MAEINIERDGKGVSLWVAIALLALAVFIAWLLLSNPSGDATVGDLDSIGNPITAESEDAGTVEEALPPR